MRFSVLRHNRHFLVRGGAVLLVFGMAAGCSSGVSRFDDILTASSPNQRSIINKQPNPFSGDAHMAAPVASARASLVNRDSPQSVSSQTLPAPVAQVPALDPAPVQTAQASKLEPAVDRTQTGSVAQPQEVQNNTLKLPGKKQLPATLPSEKVAVLPQQPNAKEAAAVQLASADNNAKPAGSGGDYKVVDGDMLNRIAKKLGVTTEALKEVNGLQDGRIRVGQLLKVPVSSAPVAKAASVVDPVVTATAATETPKPDVAAAKPAAEAPAVAAYTPPKKDKLVQRAEESPVSTPNSTGIDRMRWPVRGRVLANYGKDGGKSNDGIDISVPEGTPVKAAENGVVIYAGDGLKEFGNTVLVRHENGIVTVYGHASQLKVQRGQKVKRGDDLALSGMSGSTDVPKLHFEVRKNSTPVDPNGYLE